MKFFIFFLVLFGAYALGRLSHIIGGKLGDRGFYIKYSPHHWVYGALAIIVGLILVHHRLGRLLIAFGIGFVISDLNDLLKGRVFDVSHEPEIKKFWGID